MIRVVECFLKWHKLVAEQGHADAHKLYSGGELTYYMSYVQQQVHKYQKMVYSYVYFACQCSITNKVMLRTFFSYLLHCASESPQVISDLVALQLKF